jgi:hypothetical protein
MDAAKKSLLPRREAVKSRQHLSRRTSRTASENVYSPQRILLNKLLWFVLISLKDDEYKTAVHKLVDTGYTLDLCRNRYFRSKDRNKNR